MDLRTLLQKNRSYRGYDESRKITREELMHLITCARLCPSGNNLQPLKYFLSCDGETNARIQPFTAWAGKLRPGKILPYEGHRPTAFIVMCVDEQIQPNAQAAQKDAGIAAMAITLGAAEMGLGACMIGAFKPELKQALALGEALTPILVIAIGKPDETIVLTDKATDGTIDYYRDENDVHYVPKRTLDELIVH